MMNEFSGLLMVGLRGISDVVTAAIAITSLSLFLFSLTFQLHDRVTLTYSAILFCIVIVFAADAFTVTDVTTSTLRFLLQAEWIGIISLPTVYFHFSDALLALTGKPSRWRRRLVGWICVFISIVFFVALFFGELVGELRTSSLPVPALSRTFLSDVFALYFLVVMAMSWYNISRALKRTTSVLSRRRMIYLMVGAIGPAFGAFPFLLYGSGIASAFPILFWILSVLSNLGVAVLIIVMAYAVSFFGFSWPDRVIKRRLLKLVLRGPVTASITLAVTTLISRFGSRFGQNVGAFTVLGMVGSIVLMQLAISIASPWLESWLLWGDDREELKTFRDLEDRLLTTSDYNQLQNMLLTSLSDRLQAKSGFLCEIVVDRVEIISQFGDLTQDLVEKANEFYSILKKLPENGYITAQDWFLLKLSNGNRSDMVGFFALNSQNFKEIDPDEIAPIAKIAERSSQAILDRREQEALIRSMELIYPKFSILQQLLAASRYDRKDALEKDIPLSHEKFDDWVKDALSQMWGGPKMVENPLMQLSIVRNRISKFGESDSVALREILKLAINKLKPEGQRLYTNEWIIFNILDLKYLEGLKVKDITRKLSLSEADFFRKQRVAFNQVSHELRKMENQFTQH